MSETTKNSTIRWIRTVAGKKKWYIAVLLIVQIWLGISGVIYALFMRSVIDEAVAGNRSAFLRAVILLVGLVVLQIACQAIGRFMGEYARSGYENCFKSRLFQMLLYRDYQSVNATHSGEWMNRLTSDTVVVADGLTNIVPGVAGMIVKMIGALIMIFYLQPRFGLILIPGGILVAVFSYAFRKVLKKLHKKMQEADGVVRMFLQENLGSLMVVKAFAREQATITDAEEKMKVHRRARMKKNHFSNLCNVGFGAAMNGIYVIGVIYCGHGILTGAISYGTLMAVLQLISQIQAPFANITGYLPRYYAMLASAERLMEAEVFDADLDVTEKALDMDEIRKIYQKSFVSIGMKKLTFSYGMRRISTDQMQRETRVLEDFNLEIKKGEYVALTGPSGCGKSTLMKILLCLYKPQSGERYFTLRESEEKMLTSAHRKMFAYVPQGNHLMSGTIREIVSFAEQDAGEDEERLSRALTIACAKDFVDKLPKGVDTLLGERGLGLSEGQMQRIAIARAIFADNPILMLDEATSALDETTEAQVLMNLRNMTNKIVLIVTHRPAALEICDRVVSFGETYNN